MKISKAMDVNEVKVEIVNLDTSELVNSMDKVVAVLNQLNSTISQGSSDWWDTQWFSAVIGATAAMLGSWVVSSFKERNKRLWNYYQWLLHQLTFSSVDVLIKQAQMTSYSGEKSGDKTLAEKMVIEFRSHTKYWYEPMSRIRLLLRWYELALWNIKDGKTNEVILTKEYREAERRFKAAEDYLYKKTGESEWTS